MPLPITSGDALLNPPVVDRVVGRRSASSFSTPVLPHDPPDGDQSQRKRQAATEMVTTAHAAITKQSVVMALNPAPSFMTWCSASLAQASGRTRAMSCTTVGSELIGKKSPLRNMRGKVI